MGLDGAIDFMCWPCFDSPSIFAALLDDTQGGCFEIKPALENVHYRQLYFSDTNALLTRFLSADGVAEISDLMPPATAHPQQNLVRRYLNQKLFDSRPRVEAPSLPRHRTRCKKISP